MSTPALDALGWDAARATEFSAFLAAGLVPGRIARPGRSAHLVLTGDGPVTAAVAPALAKAVLDPTALPTVGDWVGLRRDGDPPLVEAMLPRRTAIVRRGAGVETTGHVLAANVDTVLVVVPTVPTPKLGRLERFLTLAWESGATPAVVVTKADLAGDLPALVAEVARSAPGVGVHAVSAVTGDGLDALVPHLAPGRTLVLVGASGAGKSTLANALLGSARLATQDIRADGKGRHTTTHRELVPLPSGAVLIDTPGLRGVGLWGESDGLERAFTDIESLATGCRFSDCRHEAEPGCAVLGAVADGTLDARRVDNYRRLERELKHVAMKHDARLRSAERAKWRSISKSLRQHPPRG